MLYSTFYLEMFSPNPNGVTGGIPQIMMCLCSLTLVLPKQMVQILMQWHML